MRQEMTTLGESCQFFNGKAHEKDIDAEGKYVVVNSKFISRDGKVRKYTGKQMFPLFEDDIVMVMSDVPNGKALAKCYIIEENDKYSLNQRICAIRTSVFNIRFLYYQLNRNPFFLAFNNGENQSNLRKGDILNCPLWKPSLEIQEEIVDLLDESLNQITIAEDNIQKNIINAQEVFHSRLNNIFNQKDNDWQEEKMVDVCSILTCGVASTPKYVDESIGVPFLSAQNVRNGRIVLDKFKYISQDFHKHLTKKNKPQKGDILYSRVGAKFGEAGVVEHNFEFSVYVSVTLIRPIPEKLNNYYFKHYLNSPVIKSLAKSSITSSGVPNLNVKTVREFPVYYPSIEKQKDLVVEIEQLESAQLEIVKVYQQKLKVIRNLKKSILQKAFAGELTKNAIAI